MDKLVFFSFKDDGGTQEQVEFEPFSDTDGLPFPLYLPFMWRLFLCGLLGVSLVLGIFFRFVIMAYLKSPSSKVNFDSRQNYLTVV